MATTYTDSNLVTYTKILSNNTYGKRTHIIDTVTIHCTSGNGTAESIINVLEANNCSCNYTIGYDGSIGLCLSESHAAWTSSSYENDNRAITIEVSSNSVYPTYDVEDKAYQSLIKLLVDICTRNGGRRLVWFGSKSATLAYNPKPNEMRMTVHRWFANKECPGDYLYNKHPDIVKKVNSSLQPEFKVRYSANDSYWGNLRDKNSKAYKYYYSDNVFYTSGYGLPNCTCYAYGRAYELLGKKPKLSTANAGNWYPHNKNTNAYDYGTTPKVGAIMCWDDPNDAGHVAVVEKVSEDNKTLVISESGWNTGIYCRKATMTKTSSGWHHSEYWTDHYIFQGFIYIGDFSNYSSTNKHNSIIDRQWQYEITSNYIWSSNFDDINEKQLNNGIIIAQYFLNKGWTLNAICGMLGNMLHESMLNPGQWQGGGPAFGLCQWDPARKIRRWIYDKHKKDDNDFKTINASTFDFDSKSDTYKKEAFANGTYQCERIQWECEHDQQWFGNPDVDKWPSQEGVREFSDFAHSDKSARELAKYFLWFYEHPSDPYTGTQKIRGNDAEKWYKYFQEHPEELQGTYAPYIDVFCQMDSRYIYLQGSSGGKKPSEDEDGNMTGTQYIKVYYKWDASKITFEKDSKGNINYNKNDADGVFKLPIEEQFTCYIRKPRLSKSVFITIVVTNASKDNDGKISNITNLEFPNSLKLDPSYPCINIYDTINKKFNTFVPYINDNMGKVNMYVPVIRLSDGWYGIFNTDIEKLNI